MDHILVNTNRNSRPARSYQTLQGSRNPKPPPVTDETLQLMKQCKIAKFKKDSSYSDLNISTKRAIRKDIRQSIS